MSRIHNKVATKRGSQEIDQFQNLFLGTCLPLESSRELFGPRKMQKPSG
jgi:hypothetical protein